MLIDWLFSKLGMLLLLLLLLGTLSRGYSVYDTYNAQREAEALAEGIAEGIAEVARAAPQYSTAEPYSRVIPLPEDVHGGPYLLRLDENESLVEVVLLGAHGGSGRAFLPAVLKDPAFVGFETGEDGSQKALIEGGSPKLRLTREADSRLNVSLVGG